MKVEDSDGKYKFSAPVISSAEAERLTEGLENISLEEIGTPRWMKQHAAVSKLNLQAHQCVMAKTDNFVLEAMVTFDKVSLLVQQLLVAEVWSKHVFPLLRDKVVELPKGSLRCYFVLYHQATLINLLEVILYHDYVAQAAGDIVIDLVDFCARQVNFLNRMRREKPAKKLTAKELAKKIKHMDPVQDLQRQADELAYRVAISSVCVLRFLTEHVVKLPLGVMTRLLDTHDITVATVPLIENPPWTRRTFEGTWQKYIEGEWKDVSPEDLLSLTKSEAQVWLILYNLLCEGECRKVYAFNSFRKDSILRVRKYINELLLDQLPMLAHLQRYMDELTIMEAPPATTSSTSRFVLEQVATFRDQLITKWRKSFPSLAQMALDKVFNIIGDDNDLKELAGLYGSDTAMSVFAPLPAEGRDEAAAKARMVMGAVLTITVQGDQGQESTQTVQYTTRSDVEPTISQTSQGTFRRFHLSPLQSGLPPLAPDAEVQCIVIDIEGEEFDAVSATLALPSQPLGIMSTGSCGGPATPPAAPATVTRSPFAAAPASEALAAAQMVTVDTSFPTVKWVKLGAMDDGLVAQIKCQRRTSVLRKHASEGRLHCYGIGDMFVSVNDATVTSSNSSATITVE